MLFRSLVTRLALASVLALLASAVRDESDELLKLQPNQPVKVQVDVVVDNQQTKAGVDSTSDVVTLGQRTKAGVDSGSEVVTPGQQTKANITRIPFIGGACSGKSTFMYTYASDFMTNEKPPRKVKEAASIVKGGMAFQVGKSLRKKHIYVVVPEASTLLMEPSQEQLQAFKEEGIKNCKLAGTEQVPSCQAGGPPCTYCATAPGISVYSEGAGGKTPADGTFQGNGVMKEFEVELFKLFAYLESEAEELGKAYLREVLGKSQEEGNDVPLGEENDWNIILLLDRAALDIFVFGQDDLGKQTLILNNEEAARADGSRGAKRAKERFLLSQDSLDPDMLMQTFFENMRTYYAGAIETQSFMLWNPTCEEFKCGSGGFPQCAQRDHVGCVYYEKICTSNNAARHERCPAALDFDYHLDTQYWAYYRKLWESKVAYIPNGADPEKLRSFRMEKDETLMTTVVKDMFAEKTRKTEEIFDRMLDGDFRDLPSRAEDNLYGACKSKK